MLTCCRDRWVVVGPAARIYWSHRDCKCLTTAILTATVPHIAPRRKRHYVNIIQISHKNLLPRFKLVSLWKKAPSEIRVAPWMETCFRCFESVLSNSLLLVCQFSFSPLDLSVSSVCQMASAFVSPPKSSSCLPWSVFVSALLLGFCVC